ncbi:hypothetical protein [Actinomadura chokoriensis]|uniref:Uncharacterized protein n=1 Tax=Actinomadura chokoriensis TaxID=454156 RepID=A0ABV4R3Y8_9ACTN
MFIRARTAPSALRLMMLSVEFKKSPPDWRQSRTGRAMRLMGLLVLWGCGLLTFARAVPLDVPPSRLADDLAEGRVGHLERESGEHALADGGSVRWSTGLLTWYQASLPGPGGSSDGAGVFGEDAPEETLERLITDSPQQVKVTPVQDLHGERNWWENRHPAQFAPAAGLLWLLLLVVMARRPDHRSASRWAWFWLFTVGQLGALAYLLVEPRPLWTRDAGEAHASAPRLSGVSGFLVAIPLGLATAGAAFALRAALT